MKRRGRGRGVQIDPPLPEKTTLKKPSLIRVSIHLFDYIVCFLVSTSSNAYVPTSKKLKAEGL